MASPGAGGPDAGASTPLDSGASTPPSSVPDGSTPGCGNRTREPGELCDGDEVACESLTPLYTAGAKARCRADCRGYDVSACGLVSGQQEAVQPAVREPGLWPYAQCNRDGAFPLFVQRTTSKNWVIRLEGGGACSPAGGAACYSRAASLVAPVLDGAPIVDRTTSSARRLGNVPESFADANYALLIYCSSDVWTGTQTENTPIPAGPSGSSTMPWRFSGRFNVAAAIEILEQRYGLDDGDPATRVFLQGSSAGGHGVLHNVDQAKRLLPKTSGAKRLWALANAASYFPGWRAADATVDGDWSGLDATGAHTGLYWEEVLPTVFTSWKADLGSPQCTAVNSAATCFFASELQPYLVDPEPKGLGVPVAIANNLEDPNPQDEFGIIVKGPPRAFAPGGAAASKAWGDAHKTALAKARWVFAPRAPLGIHGVPFETRGTGIPTLQRVMDRFVEKGEPDAFSFLDFAPLVAAD